MNGYATKRFLSGERRYRLFAARPATYWISARRAVERDDDAAAVWVKQVWPCANG